MSNVLCNIINTVIKTEGFVVVQVQSRKRKNICYPTTFDLVWSDRTYCSSFKEHIPVQTIDPPVERCQVGGIYVVRVRPN